jgi:hypothetical protein
MTSHAVRIQRLDSVPLAVIKRQVTASELSRVVPECCGLVWDAALRTTQSGSGAPPTITAWPDQAGRFTVTGSESGTPIRRKSAPTSTTSCRPTQGDSSPSAPSAPSALPFPFSLLPFPFQAVTVQQPEPEAGHSRPTRGRKSR